MVVAGRIREGKRKGEGREKEGIWERNRKRVSLFSAYSALCALCVKMVT
jgi:hypothetical protein